MIPIILVTYKNPEVEARCISAVERYVDPERFELLLIDNGEADRNLAVVWNEAVAEHAEEDGAFLLLNSDAFLVDVESLQILARTLSSASSLAAVGPMTDNAGSLQSLKHPHWRSLPSGKHVELGRPEGSFRRKVLVDRHLSGFCLLVRTAAWKDLGRFEGNAPFYGQESAFIEAAWAKDWHTAIALDAFVEHLGGATAKKYLDVDAEKARGAAWFRDYKRKIRA